MNSNMMEMHPSVIDIIGGDDDDDSSTIDDDDTSEDNSNPRSGTHIARLSYPNTDASGSSTGTASKRQKDISPCYVCGAKAHGYNFDQITCESCKAFFRRNALKPMDRFRCRNNDKCVITVATRKRCKRCRLVKCFKVGMRKEWILTEEEKRLKRRKIERNRLIKQQAQLALQQKQQKHQHPTNNDMVTFPGHVSTSPSGEPSSSSSSSTSISSRHLLKRTSEPCVLPLPSLCMYHPSDQQMYERHQCLLQQMSHGYQRIAEQYPQPNKFAYRNLVISQTTDMEAKIQLVKDLTRELTQMTTSRLLHYFTLIPEFQLLTQTEKKAILIKNMLAVFMFHGALTYNTDNDTFVDRTTADQPYDAKYLLLVYGSRVYNHFVALARGLTSVTYQTPHNKESDERAHTLFLLLMVILLFSDGFESDFAMITNDHQSSLEMKSSKPMMSRSLSTTSESASSSCSSISSSNPTSPISKFNGKLHKIQQIYVELTCRYLHDEFGLTVGRRMFQDLVPLLLDLQKLCSTLANVNLCELAEEDDRSSSRSVTTAPPVSRLPPPENEYRSVPNSSSSFNSTMISGTSHLNELQKENRAPPPSNSFMSSTSSRSALSNASLSSSASPPGLSDTIASFQNHRLS